MSHGSAHVDPETGRITLACRSCPSWSPTFDGDLAEVEASEVLARHLRMAHSIETGAMAPDTPAVDIVVVARVATPVAGAPEFLAETLGDIVRNMLNNRQAIDQLGLGMTQSAVFIKPLGLTLELGITQDDVRRWVRDWRGREDTE